jgi:hypothetical protein
VKDLSFGWDEPGSLAVELAKRIRQISLEFAFHRRPVAATLWRTHGSGLKLYSKMHDVDDRKEVGVLQFRHVFAPQPDETTVNVPPAFESDIILHKLVILESGIKAESGVVLTTVAGNEIVVVAGAYPYSLAVHGLSSLPHVFEPEYPLNQYLRLPIK